MEIDSVHIVHTFPKLLFTYFEVCIKILVHHAPLLKHSCVELFILTEKDDVTLGRLKEYFSFTDLQDAVSCHLVSFYF